MPGEHLIYWFDPVFRRMLTAEEDAEILRFKIRSVCLIRRHSLTLQEQSWSQISGKTSGRIFTNCLEHFGSSLWGAVYLADAFGPATPHRDRLDGGRSDCLGSLLLRSTRVVNRGVGTSRLRFTNVGSGRERFVF